MKRRWAVVGVALGVAAGVAASASLGAFGPPDKEQRVLRAGEQIEASAQTGTATTDTKFVEIDPARVFDSRIAAYPKSGVFPRNTSRVVNIQDGRNAAGLIIRPEVVPVGATAIAYNLTVAGQTGPNFVSVTPGNATGFTTSAVNFNGTSDVANAGIVSIVNREVKIWNGSQAGATHVIIDVTGYFVKPMWAEVDKTGTITSSSRVVSVQTFPPGEYHVVFDRSVRNCAWSATIGDDGSEPAGVIDTAAFGADNKIIVFTQSNDGVPPAFENRSFYLVVTC